LSYELDPVGNRQLLLSGVTGINSQTLSYDANDRLTNSYDSNGNTLAAGGRTFAYDSQDRLTKFNGGAVTMVYDGDGNRVEKTVAGVTTQYLVDDTNPTGLPQVAEEIVGGAVERRYVYGVNRISQMQAGTTRVLICPFPIFPASRAGAVHLDRNRTLPTVAAAEACAVSVPRFSARYRLTALAAATPSCRRSPAGVRPCRKRQT